jgi:hypothetical protein
MKKSLGKSILLWTLALAAVPSPVSHAEQPAETLQANCSRLAADAQGRKQNGELFARTELFFGRAKSDGSVVSEEDFRRFLDQEVTPRFPNGLTLMSGTGQFRGASGMITREDAVLLILLYSTVDRQSSEKIDQIRESYKREFHQESVLRVDSRNCVSF